MKAEYRGVSLGKSSYAYELWQNKDFKKLDQHLKQLDKNNQELIERYTRTNGVNDAPLS